MKLTSTPMELKWAMEILKWKYEAPYDLYNNEPNEESIKELLDLQYFAIMNSNDGLVGFYCLGDAAQVPAGRSVGAYDQNALDIGIGMNPDLTGKGQGKSFFTFILNDIEKDSLMNVPIRLTVASFNHRAIRLYENLGFKKESEFNGPSGLFITMLK
jgi:[ribosomal protein S18]-alanine N-acetyltransferase